MLSRRRGCRKVGCGGSERTRSAVFSSGGTHNGGGKNLRKSRNYRLAVPLLSRFRRHDGARSGTARRHARLCRKNRRRYDGYKCGTAHRPRGRAYGAEISLRRRTRKAGSRHGKTKGENIRSRGEMQFFRRGKQGYKGAARREKQIRGCALCARLLRGVPHCLCRRGKKRTGRTSRPFCGRRYAERNYPIGA